MDLKQADPGDYTYFARAGFTDAARREAESLGAPVIGLDTLDAVGSELP